MRFEYQRHDGRLRNTYSDELLDSIFHQKADLKIDVDKELEVLKTLKAEIETQLNDAEERRNSILDWDLPEYDEADEVCFDLSEKIDVLTDWIEYFEELSEKL